MTDPSTGLITIIPTTVSDKYWYVKKRYLCINQASGDRFDVDASNNLNTNLKMDVGSDMFGETVDLDQTTKETHDISKSANLDTTTGVYEYTRTDAGGSPISEGGTIHGVDLTPEDVGVHRLENVVHGAGFVSSDRMVLIPAMGSHKDDGDARR